MSDITKRVLWSIGLWIPSAAVGVILRKLFQAWGIFDSFSKWLGGWLKMHVTTAQLEWTIAGILALLAYAALFWMIWSRRIPLSVTDTASERGIGDNVEKAVATDANRYMTAYEAIHYLADNSRWGNESRQYIGADGMKKNTLFEAPIEFKRIAEQGGIHAVGQLNGVGQHIEIPETYWMSAIINRSSIQNHDISETMPAVPNPDGIPIYKNVRILRADVERAWPRKVKK